MSSNNEKSVLSIQNLYKNYIINGAKRNVLNDINLEIKKGEFVSIIGPSGCGKSTLLKIIISLEGHTSGKIYIDSEEQKGVSDKISMIFQEARLFPWLSAEKNVEFVINDKIPNKDKEKIARDYLKLVGLEGFEEALPSQLSGGMQQRVSIARALATKPEILLLDEPFGALDAFTRIDMQKEALRIWQQEHTTMIMVTHDIDEAIYLSDRVVILGANPGEIKDIVEIDLPRPRERNTLDFMQIRRKLMLGLYDQEKMGDIEYYL